MKKTALALALAALCGSAQAEVHFNGFASIIGGATLSNDQEALGYDSDISFKPDSLFALQASSDLGNGLSATAQLMAKGADDYNVKLEWAYLSYVINDNWTLHAGKLRAPLFRYSSYLDVGYAYTWLRPPVSVYNVPFNTIEGVRLDNTEFFGQWESNIKLFAGSYNGELRLGRSTGTGDIKNAMGVSWELNRDWLTLRGTYSRAKVSATLDDAAAQGQLDTLASTFTNLNMTNLANSLATKDDTGTFWGVGFGIDKDNWLLNSEYTHYNVDNSLVATTSAFYASVGYRFGNVTPYYTYETFDAKPERESVVGLPAQLAIPVTMVYDNIRNKTKTNTIGLRWDFQSSAAFKVEFNDIRNNIDSSRNAKVISAGVDLVF